MKKEVYECDICGKKFDNKIHLMRGVCLGKSLRKQPIDICYRCKNQLFDIRQLEDGHENIIKEAIKKINDQRDNLPEDHGTTRYGIDLALQILQETVDKNTVRWSPFGAGLKNREMPHEGIF